MDGTGQEQVTTQFLRIKLFNAYAEELMPIFEVFEIRIIQAAKDLVQEFRDRREELHDKLAAEYDSKGEKRPSSLYSKPQLFFRDRRGSLQVYWQDVHQNKGKKESYRPIRKNNDGDYNVKFLQARAGYASDLVGEFEPRAQAIRQMWRDLMDAKRAVRYGLQRMPAETATLAREHAREHDLVPRSPRSDPPSHVE